MFEPFADVQVAVMDWLEATFDELARDTAPTGRVKVNDETPADLQSLPFFVRVEKATGTDDRVTDYSVVDIEVFAPTRQGARDLAERIRAGILDYPHRIGAVVLDRVLTETAPQSLPWDAESTWRFGATYRISARR